MVEELTVGYLAATSARNRALNGLVDHAPPGLRHVALSLDDGDGPLAADMADRGVRAVGLSAPGGLRGVPAAAAALRRALPALALDVLHTNLVLPALAAELARVGARGAPPIVYTRHHNRENHLRGGPRSRFVDRWTARRADRVIAVAEAAKRTMVELEGVPAAKVDVVHNGFDWSVTAPSPGGPDRWRARHPGTLVVAVGRLDAIKDVPTLVHAVGLAARERPDLRLLVAGAGDEAPILAAAAAAGIPERVALLGPVDDVFDLMSAADVFGQASLDEACSQTIIEAMGLGVPLAVTTTGGTPELVGDAHPPLPARRPDLLAGRILDVLADPGARARAAAAAPAVRERFSSAAQARAHLDVYRKVRRAR